LYIILTPTEFDITIFQPPLSLSLEYIGTPQGKPKNNIGLITKFIIQLYRFANLIFAHFTTINISPKKVKENKRTSFCYQHDGKMRKNLKLKR